MAVPETEYLRIGELARRAGVSVATIKFYIREALLPRPPVKTGRTMGYYDPAYLERLKLIRKLRDEHFLPIRVIRRILGDRGDAPLAPSEAALLARVAPGVMKKLDPEASDDHAVTREELAARFAISVDDLALLEDMGLVGEMVGDRRRYGRVDVELLEALERAEGAGLTRERFPIEGLGHYVELVGELARREVRTFLHQAELVPAAELQPLAERAAFASEPVVAIIRRKLILRALRAELERPTRKAQKKQQTHKETP